MLPSDILLKHVYSGYALSQRRSLIFPVGPRIVPVSLLDLKALFMGVQQIHWQVSNYSHSGLLHFMFGASCQTMKMMQFGPGPVLPLHTYVLLLSNT